MTQVYLISEKQLREATLINDNTESVFLNKAILDAQEVNLQEVIGSALYNSLKDQIVKNNMKSDYYKTLLDEYIAPYLINQVMATITIPLHFKFRNSGVVINSDQHYTSATLNEVTYVEQHYKNLATFNANRMVEYILKNKDRFEEINDNECEIKLNRNNTKNPIHFRK